MSSPKRVKTLVARALCLPSIGRAIARVCDNRIKCGTCVINTQSHLVKPATKAALFWGFYESAELRLVRRYLDLRHDVIELGTSIGVVAATIAKQLPTDRHLLCVEAHPRLARLAYENICANAPHAHVSMISAAIDYSETQCNLWLKPGSLTTGGHVSSTPDEEHGISVQRTTLADLIRSHGLGKYSLVADIEGAEARLLECERPALANCQQLIIELHQTKVQNRAVTIDELICTIVDAGFVVAARDGNVFVFDRG
jgi:FkbM family methyltransferase